MSLADDIIKNASDVYKTKWAERKGVVVPEPSSVTLGNDAVKLETATVLYAERDQSTSLVESKKWEFAAEVYKTFLYAAIRLIQIHGGSIVSDIAPNFYPARCKFRRSVWPVWPDELVTSLPGLD